MRRRSLASTLMTSVFDRSAGIPNLRDIGGHGTGDGRRVRRGLLFRSVALSHVVAGDLAGLEEVAIRTVFDLRTAREQAHHPDRLPDGATVLELDVMADAVESDPVTLLALFEDPVSASAELADGGMDRFLAATYRDLVLLSSARAAYGRLFGTLADPQARPALVHCTAGKDRTGWAVAALLLLLGVPQTTVLADYLRSDEEVRHAFAPAIDGFEARGGQRAVYRQLLGVEAHNLESAIATMLDAHGTVENYFSDGLGVDAATQSRLREAFLEQGQGRP